MTYDFAQAGTGGLHARSPALSSTPPTYPASISDSALPATFLSRMTYFVYDGSFDGLLCACHRIYRSGRLPDDIRVFEVGHTFFMGDVARIRTDERRARAIEAALKRAADPELPRRLRLAFRSSEPGVERVLLRLMIGLLGRPANADDSFPEPRPEHLLEGLQIAERLARQVEPTLEVPSSSCRRGSHAVRRSASSRLRRSRPDEDPA